MIPVSVGAGDVPGIFSPRSRSGGRSLGGSQGVIMPQLAVSDFAILGRGSLTERSYSSAKRPNCQARPGWTRAVEIAVGRRWTPIASAQKLCGHLRGLVGRCVRLTLLVGR